jgi:hypothetical protein
MQIINDYYRSQLLSLLADGDDGGCWSIGSGGNSVRPCGGDAGLVVVVA